jgi:hypothetical protein
MCPSSYGLLVNLVAIELIDGVSEILEENGAYLSDEADSWKRHFPEAAALDALSVLITSVILPILTSVIADEVKQRLKHRRMRADTESQADLDQLVEQAGRAPAPDQQHIDEAASVVAQALERHGWPKPDAYKDGMRVVIYISATIWRRAA